MDVMFRQSDSPFRDDGNATPNELEAMMRKADAKYWSAQIELTKVLKEMHGENAQISQPKIMQFYKEQQRPHWGQPSILWAALTMALLTLPVVIVSVEEAIKTVPMSLREASLALGATKLTTIIKVVIPGSITGIMTGGILAVSRGAGEVAPILFTGAAYYLPDLPQSLSSQFMELGYHIYVLTTQSTNVQQTMPLQYATTFVLLALTFTLNFSAIFLRSKIRRKLAKLGN
jgi:ABC-type phosphate transport system permease subunit